MKILNENKSVCVCIIFFFFFLIVNTKISLVDKESYSRVNIGPYYYGINIGPILSIGPNRGNKSKID